MAEHHVLVCLQHDPLLDGRLREGIDAAMAMAAFGACVTVMFVGKATRLFALGNCPQGTAGHSLLGLAASLPLYDVNTIIVSQSCIDTYVTGAVVPEWCVAVTASDIKQRLHTQHNVLGF